ncbi:Lipase (class 3), putative [Angomonas deanei]|uniref:sn-1-specific diacylglycerol lipase n=1 Tax=Angomonas deanei TaxID=59799 RepID=A0A7G2CQY8_9TRYP|nr:Lipase (class 3), putative [Angomonas deanei]
MSTKWALYDGEYRLCNSKQSRRFMEAAVALNFASSCLFFLAFAIAFDFSGRKEYHSTEDYAEAWWKRCRILCCRCGKKSDDDAYRDVAHVLALAFRGYDMVPSDLMAGMILLHGYQEQSRRIISSYVTYPPHPLGYKETKASQARPAPRLTPAQTNTVFELMEYSPYYLGAYGWMLFQYQHCCTGVCQLCCFNPSMCCAFHPGKHYGTKSHCNLTALLKVTQLPESAILLTCWVNSLFKPVHYVAYDEEKDSIIIAIRGTMSFIDCLTDFAAIPSTIPLKDTPSSYTADSYFVHGGMYESAQFVWRSLEYNGIFLKLNDKKYAKSKVVVLGHSLGAGVALILSCMMWSEFRSVRHRLRCLAYAPPGGTMSEAVVQYCASFSVGTFMGYDMIPRLAQHTFDLFRESIFDVLAASTVPKSLLFLNILRSGEVARAIHPSSPTIQPPSPPSQQYRDALREHPCVPQQLPKLLYPCSTLVHFFRAVSCKTGILHKEDIYVPLFIGHQDVQMLLSSPTMFTDHFPDKLERILRATCRRLERGELDRFFVAADPSSARVEVEEAPMQYVASPVRSAPYGSTLAREDSAHAV